MILSIVGRQCHFGEVTKDCRNRVYLGGEDRHEYEVWYSSAERHGDSCIGLPSNSQADQSQFVNIIKDKKWIGMNCASITRAGENRSRWREGSWSSG